MSRETKAPEAALAGGVDHSPNPAFREGFLVILSGEPENREILRRFGELLHVMVGETVRMPCPVPLVYAETEAALLDLVEVTERLREAGSYVEVGDPSQALVGVATGRQAKALRKVTAALEQALAEVGAGEEDPDGERGSR